jgi:Ca2+-transporting ATPase
MAIGALSLSQKRILTRRTAAVEALGTTTVLCVDKTGTLTYNQMTVTELFRDGQTFCLKTERPKGEAEIPEAFHELLEYAALATDPEPFDPMDKAFTQVVSQLLGNTEHVHPEWQLVKRYPLAPELMARSNVWSQSLSAQKPVATKGSPEAIFDLCHLQVEVKAVLEAQVKGLAGQGLRVLGVAKASRIHGAAAAGSLPDSQHDFEFEFLGLVGLEDPIRLEVPAAIARCQKAGIRVMMITGDYPDTARALGQQAGLHNAHKVLTGQQLEGLSAQELKESIRDYSVCARMKPTQKSQLVSVLKSQGDIVAMTGDGVNDAPALKIAHIGIAMGKRGTDVAREASSLVLLDDDFGSMVEAIHIGRRIYDNLSKTMVYLLSVHVPIAGLAMIPIFSGAEAVMLPVHVAFLHLIIEPVCSVVFARMPGPRDLMERMPRPLTTKLFSRRMTGEVVSLGGFTLLAMMGVFFYGQSRGYDLSEVRSLVFATLLGANSALIFRQMHEGFRGVEGGFKKLAYLRPWLLISLGSVLLLLVLIYTKAQSLFLFGEPRLWHVFAGLIVGGAAILCTKLLPFNLNSAGKSPKIIVSP